MTTIKITELTNIGANLNGNTLVPVVNMNGTPVTQRSNVENLANYVLNTGTGANLGAVGNITITGGTDGYVLQTDGAGNLSWVAQTGGGNGTPGGANTQIQFNDAGSFGGDSGLTFNKTTNDLTVAGNIVSTDGNVTANWVIGDYVSGNATPLHHIPGANVTGAVSFATTANAVAAANVSGLGNVALVNFDGNSSNVLYGNGVFDSIPNPFNQDLNTTDNVTFANITSTDAIRFSNSSNIVGAMGYAPNYVSIEGYGSNSVQITTNDLLTWSFNSEGILTFPEGTTTTGSSIETPAGDDFSITTSSITSVSAPCAIAVGDEFVADTEFNDDITVVQVGWTVSINGTDYTVTYIDPSPPAHQYRITAAGATFVQNTTYTFSDPVPATHNWTISETGVLSTPGGGTISQQSDFIISVSGTDRIDLRTENGDAILDAEGNLNLTGNLVFSGGAIIDPTDNNFEVRGVQNVNFEANAVVNIYTDGSNNAYQWQFGDDGNLTLPGNTFAVNYANGSPVVISGGGGNTGNVTFDNVTVQGVNGLNLSAGADFTANLAYLQVRAGDVASHIHLDTGNNSAYDLIVGDDQNYVQVSSTGNILLSSYDSNTAQYTWTLDYNGNLILAGGNSVIQSIANSSLDPLNPNVSTMVLTPDANYNSQVLVLDPTSPGHIHLRAYAFSNIDEPAANIFLGGENTSFEVTNGANNEARIHSAGNTWTFGNDSTTTVPGHINAITNNSITLNAYDNGAGPTVQMINWNSGSETPTTIISSEVTEAVITTNVNATPYSWTFDNAGNLTLPGNLIATTASPHMTINGFSFSNSTDYSGSGNISAGGNLTITGTITSAGKMGYSVGGNATQTSTGQGVTINQLTGLVTLANRTYNAGDLEAFSISCNKVSNDDFVLVQMVDSVNAPSYNVVAYPNFVLANTISVLVKTLETVGTDTPILKFMIVKAPIA